MTRLARGGPTLGDLAAHPIDGHDRILAGQGDVEPAIRRANEAARLNADRHNTA